MMLGVNYDFHFKILNKVIRYFTSTLICVGVQISIYSLSIHITKRKLYYACKIAHMSSMRQF